jgi:sugar phosphate isomerase/epimerase
MTMRKANTKFKLSAFADEIAIDLATQLDFLVRNEVPYIELRRVNGTAVLDLTAREARSVAKQAKDRGVGFSAIGSPIGKAPLDGPFGEQMDALKKAMELAAIVEAPYIRIFSYWIPEGEDHASHRSEVIDRLHAFVKETEGAPVTLGLENEKGTFADTGSHTLDLHRSINSEAMKAVFDFSNFVQCGERPYAENWPELRPYLGYFHVKDSVLENVQIVPAGQGDGDIARILAEVDLAGEDCYLSIEHHLKEGFGESKSENFEIAAAALKGALRGIGKA